MSIRLRKMIYQDWKQVADIYFQGIQTGLATFQTQVPTWEEWDKGHVQNCRLVAVDDRDQVIGWAALSLVSSRCVYRGVAEVSIYINQGLKRKGIGKLLLERLIEDSEKEGFWMLQSGIFSNNKASLLLHKKVGFREVGIRERIGKTQEGLWQDTVLLERRSTKVGIE